MPNPDVIHDLNEQQRQAVEAGDGPLLVLAGAGTGKTRVITARIARLLHDGVPAERILAVTFTRKAASEMRERVRSLLDRTANGLTVCTFHALGLRIMREHHGKGAENGSLRIITDEEQRQHVCAALLQNGSGDDVDRVLAAISRAKNAGVSPEAYRHVAGNDFQAVIAAAYSNYQLALAAASAIDLDDMVLRPVELLEASADARSQYQRRWRHVLIDEYQDTNEGQDRLAACLIGPDCNVCVVGDDDQSIYSFRGADAERIRTFATRFTETCAVALESNYRSRAPIVALANAVITRAARRGPKRLVCEAGAGAPVESTTLTDDDHERRFIAQRLWELSPAMSWSSIAVLVRVRKLVTALMREFRTSGIPCTSSPSDDGVAVMTLHQSKGLEFPVVFLPAMEDGIIPHDNAQGDADAAEEERRLCYVGITRARERLFITSADRRNDRAASPSPFLRELPTGDFLEVR